MNIDYAVGTIYDSCVDMYLEAFGRHPGEENICIHTNDLKKYFMWANSIGGFFLDLNDDIINGFTVAKPTNFGCDWWDYDPYGVSLHLGLSVLSGKDPLTKWRLLKQILERFPHCEDVVWTRNTVNEKKWNKKLFPSVQSRQRLEKQLKKYIKE